MCIRDSAMAALAEWIFGVVGELFADVLIFTAFVRLDGGGSVSYTHLRAHETVLDLVCRLLLEKKKDRKLANTNTYEKEHVQSAKENKNINGKT